MAFLLLRTVLWMLAAAVLIYGAACASLYVFQRSLIYFPQPAAFASAANMMKLPVEGAELNISVRPRPGPEAVIYFGGNAEDVSASLPELSTAFPESALYLMHYRGYGGSSGTPSEAALHQDALALFDRVHATHADVVVIGRSLGSGIAIRLATLRPVARLVLVTPYDSLEGLARAQFPYMPVRRLLLDKYESDQYAPRVTAPTTLIAAERDDIIPRSSTDRLHARFAAGVARFIVLPNTGHNTVSENPLYLEALRGSL